MKSTINYRIIFLFFILIFQENLYAQAPSFNAQSQVIPYTTNFLYGVNSGYYGNNWSDTSVARLASNAGAGTIRLALYDWYLEIYGDSINYSRFQYYNSIHLKDNVLFLNGAAQDHLDNSIYNYPASSANISYPKTSLVFANLYQPIWTQDGSVNPDNYFANYVYKVVSIYGSKTKFFEVWNEPDAFQGVNGVALPGQPGNWYENPPAPQDLYNLNAPIFYYIRMLRIAYEIVHKYAPNDYVCTGGIGFPNFLDCCLRYTDNPVDGSVNSTFPTVGGAFFDVVSFHDYPLYNLHSWSNAINGQVYYRHSDAAAADLVRVYNSMKAELVKYGYDGSKYPAKPLICTETNICSVKIPYDSTENGTPQYQRNFMMKALVYSYKIGLSQLYSYALANNEFDPNNAQNPNDWMGLYNDIEYANPATVSLTQEGIGYKTLSTLLNGFTYDSLSTKKLNLVAGSTDGAVFTNGRLNRVLLWAKTQKDMSEMASYNYTVPTALFPSGYSVYNWDASQNNFVSKAYSGSTFTLTGDPVIFEAPVVTQTSANLGTQPKANAGSNHQTNLPNPTYLDGSASTDPGGQILQFSWKKISGPGGDHIDSSYSEKTQVYFSQTGQYIYQLTIVDNAGNSDSSKVTLNVYPPIYPIQAIISAISNISLPNVDTLFGNQSTATSGAFIAQYRWKKITGPIGDSLLNPNGSITPVSFKQPGQYVYLMNIWDSFGIKDSAYITLTITPSNIANNFSVYPNPFTGPLTINLVSSLLGETYFIIYNAQGYSVFTQNMRKYNNTLTTTFYLNNLPSGIYYLKATIQGTNFGTFIQKQ